MGFHITRSDVNNSNGGAQTDANGGIVGGVFGGVHTGIKGGMFYGHGNVTFSDSDDEK
ncbi:hypothetical protein AB0L33_30175 [Streptomyces sp. NPDC052299]|uniref:hypothetical protein n=1 Tax=Streptomyces sp. NPDC052299 TaxID=3155054 RepID=UPI0034222311